MVKKNYGNNMVSSPLVVEMLIESESDSDIYITSTVGGITHDVNQTTIREAMYQIAEEEGHPEDAEEMLKLYFMHLILSYAKERHEKREKELYFTQRLIEQVEQLIQHYPDWEQQKDRLKKLIKQKHNLQFPKGKNKTLNSLQQFFKGNAPYDPLFLELLSDFLSRNETFLPEDEPPYKTRKLFIKQVGNTLKYSKGI